MQTWMNQPHNKALFSPHKHKFKYHEVDGSVLLRLDLQKLKEDLEIKPLGTREKIMDAIQSLRGKFPPVFFCWK